MRPYVSFVVVGRNDNYGHNFLGRFQNFLSNLEYLCEKYKLPSELVIVEWNPPKKEKRLWAALKMKHSRYLKRRFVEVPENIHKSFAEESKLQLFEYLGKSTGIRRAGGEFIVITNPDIIFSEEIIELFSKKRLMQNCVYRVNRYDLSIDLPKNLRPEKFMNFCEKNWEKRQSPLFGHSLRGLRGISYLPRMLIRYLLPYLSKRNSFYRYHAAGPGDFTLMSKKLWEKIRAYPPMKINTLLDCYAVIMGIAEGGQYKLLREKIYHQYHDRPSDLNKEAWKKFRLLLGSYKRDSRKMLREKKAIRYNGPNWGLKNVKLPETIIGEDGKPKKV